ncbi:MAG: cytochrome C oxidase subunit IV family protein [Saprospiraceae bacterium]|nr:cytochrome C oxidase subunit IV family protein [Saprospiraceae bacterium]
MKLIYVYFILIVCTLVSVWSIYVPEGPFFQVIIGGLKFLLISWYFMEMKNAHAGWKVLQYFILTLIIGGLYILKG